MIEESISRMGKLELMRLEKNVLNSLLDDIEKHKLLRAIDARKSELNVDAALAECSETSLFDYEDVI